MTSLLLLLIDRRLRRLLSVFCPCRVSPVRLAVRDPCGAHPAIQLSLHYTIAEQYPQNFRMREIFSKKFSQLFAIKRGALFFTRSAVCFRQRRASGHRIDISPRSAGFIVNLFLFLFGELGIRYKFFRNKHVLSCCRRMR